MTSLQEANLVHAVSDSGAPHAEATCCRQMVLPIFLNVMNVNKWRILNSSSVLKEMIDAMASHEWRAGKV